MAKLKKKKAGLKHIPNNSDTGGLTKQQKFVGKWYFRLGFVRTLKITAMLRLLAGWPKFLSGKKNCIFVKTLIKFIIKFGRNARSHWLGERTL